MNAAKTSKLAVSDPNVRAGLEELQRDAILVVVPIMIGAAIFLMAVDDLAAGRTNVLAPANFLILVAIAVFVVRWRSYHLSAWILISGTFVVDLLLVTVGSMPEAISLLAVSVGLAAVFIGVRSSIGVAVLGTLILALVPPYLLVSDVVLRALAIGQMWGAVGIAALTARPLLTAVEWAWSSYERSRELLEQARDSQVQLKQTLEDLASANTQLARLNDYAQAMRQAAEEARQTKEQFVANVSHELRTPLNMIIGFTELMTTSPETYGGDIPATMMAHLQIVLRNSRHLSSLIDDVLDLSQIESGHMALSRERVDFADVVETAKSAVTRLFSSKGLYLEVTCAPGLPLVWCDKTRIREVILNLLSNAARFTEQGGVRLTVGLDHQYLVTAVADSGAGIAPEDIGRLFKPFEQLDGSIRRRHGGSGLGLAISKSFVEMHGGQMSIESTPGAGSMVSFRLPIDPPAPVQAETARQLNPDWEFRQRTRPMRASPPSVRPRLVVLEAGSTLQRILRRYTDNADVVAVSSAAEASAELAHTPAQLLVINDALGLQDVHQLTSQVALPAGIPAVICSLPETSDTAEALGASGYLTKPVPRDQLQATLNNLKLKRKTVLVVDDEPEALSLFMNMLASMNQGYNVLTATNGLEALRIMHRKKPSVILLDLMMPEMDGFQLLAELSRNAALKSIPVIVMSARDPAGHPIVSQGLAVTQGGGLTIQQLLATIDAVRVILSPGARPGDLAPLGNHGA